MHDRVRRPDQRSGLGDRDTESAGDRLRREGGTGAIIASCEGGGVVISAAAGGRRRTDDVRGRTRATGQRRGL